MVLHKLRFHADFVAPFSPPCEGGVRGGGRGTTGHKVVPCSLPLSPFASLTRGEKNRFRFPRLPQHPPCPPFARGGKGSLARDVIPSRATKTRVSKSSLQLCQDQRFTGPGFAPREGTSETPRPKENVHDALAPLTRHQNGAWVCLDWRRSSFPEGSVMAMAVRRGQDRPCLLRVPWGLTPRSPVVGSGKRFRLEG